MAHAWQGFHHHANLSIAAYGFLMTERLIADKTVGGKKTPSHAKCLPFPMITSPEAALRAQRHVENSIATLRHRLTVHGTIDHQRGCHAVMAQVGNERRGLPMPMRGCRYAALAARGAAVAARHVRAGAAWPPPQPRTC